MKRILLYVHFNKHSVVAAHVIYQLQELRPLFRKVVFITNSRIRPEDKEQIKGLYDTYIKRENVGFDFAAWRDGMSRIGWKDLAQYDSLTLMNDTCFGPIYSLRPVYEKMEKSNVDFWGMTDHAYDTDTIGDDKPIPHHIQSYFQVFNSNVVRSSVFQEFWGNVKNHIKVSEVIRYYETQLTPLLEKAGFYWQVHFDSEEYSKAHGADAVKDYANLAPLVILKKRTPLLKVKAFLYSPASSIKKEIVENSGYPTELIDDYLKQIGMTRTKKTRLALRRSAVKIVGAGNLRKFSKTHPGISKGISGISKTISGDR